MIKFTVKDSVNFWDMNDKIKKVHEYLFYETNLTAQMAKYRDEYNEYMEAKDEEDRIMELADMYICACGIKRFDYAIGSHLCNAVLDTFGYPREKIIDAIIEKMNILQERKWNKDDKGYYQHDVCTDENENRKRNTSSCTHSKK